MRFPRPGVGRRLLAAFVSLFLVQGVAAYMSMSGLAEMHALMVEVRHHEVGVRSALELASAVRDQYAHQAHTIILGNDTHLGFYDEARRLVLARTASVAAVADDPENRRWIGEIEHASAELDEIFRRNIVPAVLEKKPEVIMREHARAQGLVSFIQDRADHIAGGFERAIGDFEAHAGLVQHATVRWSLVSVLVAMALAGLLGVYIRNSVARPVAILEAGAERLSRGDLETHIELDTNDELGRLASQFNRMTAALKENQRHLVESEKLAGIGRLAAGVAHEINNPLAVILGYVRILERSATGSLRDDLKVIEEEATRCQEIVEDLLDLARPPKIDVQPVDLEQLCTEAVLRLSEAKKLPTAEVTVTGAATVMGSPSKLRQVIMNLVKNAAEAAGPSGRVVASIAASPTGAVVAVSDTGTGLSELERARLFEPFFTTKPHGTGLGLAVSRAIAHAHGGDIEAETRAEGGAVFTLRLPAEREEVR